MMDIGPDHVGVVIRDTGGELGEEIKTALKEKKPIMLRASVSKLWEGYDIDDSKILEGYFNRYPTFCPECKGPLFVFPGVSPFQPCPHCTARIPVPAEPPEKMKRVEEPKPVKKAKEISHPFPLCNGWIKNIDQIVWGFKMSAANDNPVKFDPWLYCPYCAVEMKQIES